MVDHINELCCKVHIKVYRNTEDELIEQFPETESRTNITETEGDVRFSLQIGS